MTHSSDVPTPDGLGTKTDELNSFRKITYLIATLRDSLIGLDSMFLVSNICCKLR